MTIRGKLADRTLNFFPQEYGYVSLQGIYAIISPGLYPLAIEGELPNSNPFTFSEKLLIQDAKFPSDPTLEVNPLTVDPAVTIPEKQLWDSWGAPVAPEKM